MKKTIFTHLFKRKTRKGTPDKPVATADDVRRKLANYQPVAGPSQFTPAGVYHVNEVDEVAGSQESASGLDTAKNPQREVEHQDS
ncbi:hypothetical protein [Ketobacter sp.]|uniref:hypothetical protein n=1 Tax=Ketobacter sp. TaxID=2083498 RepID=UPI0025C51BF7|nr:hypothetical protein [Ketobacter sp.]